MYKIFLMEWMEWMNDSLKWTGRVLMEAAGMKRA